MREPSCLIPEGHTRRENGQNGEKDSRTWRG